MSLMRIPRRRSGVTLTELMIAMVILALAFIPIIGSLGSSLAVTEKDDRAIRAMQLTQSALAAAIQFPFAALPTFAGGGPGPWQIGGDVPPLSYPGYPGPNELVMTVGRIATPKVTYQLQLLIEDVPVTFNFKTYNVASKDKYPTTPSSWGWADRSFTAQRVHHRYTMTARWTEPNGREKFCSLTSYKSDLKD